jgi:hypothetical protein
MKSNLLESKSQKGCTLLLWKSIFTFVNQVLVHDVEVDRFGLFTVPANELVMKIAVNKDVKIPIIKVALQILE